jgi:hypothetical protein
VQVHLGTATDKNHEPALPGVHVFELHVGADGDVIEVRADVALGNTDVEQY